MKKKLLTEALKSDYLRGLIKNLSEEENFEALGWISRTVQGVIMPFLDIYEEGDKITVKADVAGYRRDDLEVKAFEGEKRLKISGKREKEVRDYIEDGRTREFSRTIHLPSSVKGEGKARLEEGVLTIELNKAKKEGEGTEISVK